MSPTTFKRPATLGSPWSPRAKLRFGGLAMAVAAPLAVLAVACHPPSAAARQLSPEPPSNASAPTPAPSTPAPSPPSPAPAAGEPGRAREPIDPASAKPGHALLLQGQPLHPWCVSTLTTELNGDRIVQSIDWQGCTKSNRSIDPAYWQDGTLWYDEGKEGDRFGYSVYRTIDERTHILNVKLQTSGTFGSSNYLAVRRSEVSDWNPMAHPPWHTITTLTRLGEVWKAEEVDALVKAVTTK